MFTVNSLVYRYDEAVVKGMSADCLDIAEVGFQLGGSDRFRNLDYVCHILGCLQDNAAKISSHVGYFRYFIIGRKAQKIQSKSQAYRAVWQSF